LKAQRFFNPTTHQRKISCDDAPISKQIELGASTHQWRNPFEGKTVFQSHDAPTKNFMRISKQNAPISKQIERVDWCVVKQGEKQGKIDKTASKIDDALIAYV